MDYIEEQNNEIIVLDSIYGQEMTILKDSPHEFTIDVKYSDFDGQHTAEPPSVTLLFKYTEKYPEELPEIDIETSENLPESEIIELRSLLQDLAVKSLGDVMIYTLVTATQEWLNEYEDTKKKEAALEHEERAKIQADIERKKFEGTQVNKETFMKWKASFDSERLIVKSQEAVEKSKKLTGKELFMKDISLNESDLKFLEEDGEVVKVNETLFQNLENLDIEQ